MSPISLRGDGAAYLTLALLAIVVYANALDNPFQYDDKHSVQYNPSIRSLTNTPAFFTDLHSFSSDPRGAMFRPLLLVSYALNYAVHGQRVEGYRWVNLSLHVLVGLVLMAIVHRVCDDRLLAFTTSCVFLLHPIHTEVVNLISGRSDVMMAALYTGALIGVLGAQSPRVSAIGCVAFAAALLTKSMAITMPAAAALMQFVHSGWAAVRRRAVLYGSLAIIGLAYIWLVSMLGFLSSSAARSPRPLVDHLATQMKVHVYYLWLFANPTELSADHQFFVSSSWTEPVVLLAAGLLISLLIWTFRGRRTLLAQGYGWFVLVMLPTTLIPLNILVSERRMYLASAGFCLALALCCRDLLRRRGGFGIGVCTLLALLLGAMCVSRNSLWASELAIWQDAVAKGPAAHRARVNLGLALDRAGRRNEALSQLRIGLELSPGFADAWSEMGNILSDEGQLEAAGEAFRQALELEPELPGLHHNLGNVYQLAGRLEDAVVEYRRALDIDPSFADAHNNLGQAREKQGAPLAEAVVHYRAALSADPQNAQAWYNLAVAIERMGEMPAEALKAYSRSHELLTDDADFASNPEYGVFADRAAAGMTRLRTLLKGN